MTTTAKPVMSARKAALDVLSKAAGPMAAKDVIAAVLDGYETGLKGKTPAATVSAQLYLAAKAGEVTKAGRGMFEKLAQAPDATPPADGETPKPEQTEPADTPAEGDVAEVSEPRAERQAQPHPKPGKRGSKKEAAAV